MLHVLSAVSATPSSNNKGRPPVIFSVIKPQSDLFWCVLKCMYLSVGFWKPVYGNIRWRHCTLSANDMSIFPPQLVLIKRQTLLAGQKLQPSLSLPIEPNISIALYKSSVSNMSLSMDERAKLFSRDSLVVARR